MLSAKLKVSKLKKWHNLTFQLTLITCNWCRRGHGNTKRVFMAYVSRYWPVCFRNGASFLTLFEPIFGCIIVRYDLRVCTGWRHAYPEAEGIPSWTQGWRTNTNFVCDILALLLNGCVLDMRPCRTGCGGCLERASALLLEGSLFWRDMPRQAMRICVEAKRILHRREALNSIHPCFVSAASSHFQVWVVARLAESEHHLQWKPQATERCVGHARKPFFAARMMAGHPRIESGPRVLSVQEDRA